MRKSLLILVAVLPLFTFTSCMSIFSSAKQTITFTGEEGTKLYDGTNNVKLAEISEEGMAAVKIKKNLSDKTIIAKKKGYRNTPFVVESRFNPKALWNILFWPGFLIDLGTGKINKYDPVIYNVEMDEKE